MQALSEKGLTTVYRLERLAIPKSNKAFVKRTKRNEEGRGSTQANERPTKATRISLAPQPTRSHSVFPVFPLFFPKACALCRTSSGRSSHQSRVN